jgi:hypothetical protein
MIQTVAGAAAVLCAQQALAAAPTIVNTATVQYFATSQNLPADGTSPPFSSVQFFNNQSSLSQDIAGLFGEASAVATSGADAALGAKPVTQSARAYSDFGANHASVSTQGFDLSQTYNPGHMVCPTDAAGICTGAPVLASSLSNLGNTASASTTWNEVLTFNKADQIVFQTYHIHGVITPTSGTDLTGDGHLSFVWTQSGDAGQMLAQVRGSYLTNTDGVTGTHWDLMSTSNVNPVPGGLLPYFTYTTGTTLGAMTIDFNLKTRDLLHDDQLTISSSLSLSSSGNVSGDFSNTIGLVDLSLPDGTLITGSQSGTDYSGRVSHYSPAAVPEPETLALMLAGLGLVGVVTRRRHKPLHA